MARFKDFEWSLREGTPNSDGGTSYPIDTIKISVLMDIREQLRRLNNTLSAVGCIHSTMKGLRRDIAKARRVHRRKV